MSRSPLSVSRPTSARSRGSGRFRNGSSAEGMRTNPPLLTGSPNSPCRPTASASLPRELEEMLPQQSLLLRLAAEAIDDAGWDDRTRLRAGCLVGLGLDLNTTNFHLRWSMLDKAREWDRRVGLGLSGTALAEWVEELRHAVGPPLSANRTMGALGSIVASRVAREFRLGGAELHRLGRGNLGASGRSTSPVGCCAEGNSMRRSWEPSTCPATPALLWRRKGLRPGVTLGEGAAVVVLKRLADAERDGDRIHAVRSRDRAGRREPGFGPARSGRIERGTREHQLFRSGKQPNRSAKWASIQVAPWPRLDPTLATSARHRDWPRWSRRCSVSITRFCPLCAILAWRRWSRLAARNTGSATGSTGLAGRWSPGWAWMATWPMWSWKVMSRPPASTRPIGSNRWGMRPSALFVVEGNDTADLLGGLDELDHRFRSGQAIEALARAWWLSPPPRNGPKAGGRDRRR